KKAGGKMSKLKEKIQLSAAEVTALKLLVSKGKHPVRKVKRAQILLKLDEQQSHIAIAEAVGVSLATVYNIHDRYLAGKLTALDEKARTGQPRKVTPPVEAAVTRIACSLAPEGKARWTVSLINERIVKLGYELNDETVRLILKKAGLNLG
ncbi:helix-turn-helix domain-containing protein, partial [Adhaeribacter aerolatus]|uniref:helix-turn-helix domain-containing protein n=1 Tax=Adhaeribacter aerolatus TaxID=670289 RepID=UPI001C3FF2B8